ncbi:MAG: cyclase family protein [Micromonosporaceae bacterium]
MTSLPYPTPEWLRGKLQVRDLSRPMFPGMPQSPNHPAYGHALVRRHGDMVRADGSSGANDMIVTGTHVGTHVDALAHVAHQGKLHGGADAYAAASGGRFTVHGAETIEPFFCRGVLLDIPAALDVPECAPGYEITPHDLERAAARQATQPESGDVVLIRSGWGRRWSDKDAYLGVDSGVPGVSEAGAEWLAERGVRAAGSDSIAFEQLAAGAGHSALPVHRVLLVEHGIHIFETLALEEVAADRVYEFLFVAAPLLLVGATGSPVRPLAVTSDG